MSPESELAGRVGTREKAEKVQGPDPKRVAYFTRTTLPIDDTREIAAVLQRRFPKLVSPAREEDVSFSLPSELKALLPAMSPHP